MLCEAVLFMLLNFRCLSVRFFVDGYVIHIKNVPFRMNGMFCRAFLKEVATFKVRHYFQYVKELY